jgi:hypothetical protein
MPRRSELGRTPSANQDTVFVMVPTEIAPAALASWCLALMSLDLHATFSRLPCCQPPQALHFND